MTTTTVPTTGHPTDADTIAQDVIEHLERTWNRADGSGFSAVFADDADFVDIRGAHHVGRAAVAAGHQGVFDTIYAGSTVRYELDRARPIATGCVVAVVSATLCVPHGPQPRTDHARFTLTLTEGEQGWSISAFHNTLVPPTA